MQQLLKTIIEKINTLFLLLIS